jgi:type I restriction enzyme S subunit
MISSVLTDFEFAPFDIIDGDRGKNYPKQDEFASEGHCLFLSATNVTKSGFDFSDCQFISEQKDAALRKGKLRRGDVVLTTRGTIGNSAYYSDVVQYDHMRINSGMVILRCDTENILPVYLYHFLRSPSFFGQVNSLRSGVAQPQLPIRDMKKIKLPLPSVKYQSQISSVLFAYDDLIENNRRRIQLLEQVARLLYKEWFVHLRFPGHEHNRIVDGVPDGWEKKPLGSIAPLKYGKALKNDNRIPGPFPVYGSSGIVGTHAKALVPGPTIIVGRKGNVGSVYRSPDDCHPIDTVYYIDSGHCSFFLYYALQQMTFISTDVAVPGLNRDFAHSRSMLVADQKILRLFEETISPLHQQMELLKRQNASLTKARDLLLPKLMCGEIIL